MSEATVKQLKEIIAEKLDVNLTFAEIDENVSLFEDGLGLDSIAIVDLIVLLEKEYSINIDDDELNADLFKSLTTLSAFIETKIKN